MTPAKAAGIRAERIEGKRQSRKEIREQALSVKQAEAARNTIGKLWIMYNEFMSDRKSLRTDSSLFRLHLEQNFSSKIPDEICTIDIDTIRQRELKIGKSPQTVKHILGLLRRIIRFGVKRGLCQAPDQSKLYFEMPTVDNQKTESLNAEQLEKYMEAINREEDQNAVSLLRLALSTGMRKGALLALRWDDIDFEHEFITLRGDAAKKGKTEKIPLTQTARDILSRVERSESPYVFPGKKGGQRRDFRKIALRVRKNAGLPDDFRPLHGLRHAYASFLASSGQVDLYTLQKLLTHGSPQMTQRYAHLADEALQRAAGVIDSILPAKKEINNEYK
jgi:integrase